MSSPVEGVEGQREAPSAEPNASPDWLIPLGLIAAATLFFAGYATRYAPPTGVTELVGMQFPEMLPYRDYFYQAPPGIPILARTIAALTGPSLLEIIEVGILLRISAMLALFGLLKRMSSPLHAAIASFTALALASTDISDTPFTYNHASSAFVLLATYGASFGGAGKQARHSLATVLAGGAAVFAVALKQTMVFGVAAGFVAACLLVAPRPLTGWVRWIVSLVVGAALALFGIWAWLAALELVDPFMQAMVSAPQGKGGVITSLLRPLAQGLNDPGVARATVAAWLLIALAGAVHIADERGWVPRGTQGSFAALAALGSLSWVGLHGDSWEPRSLALVATSVGWWGSLAIAAIGLVRSRRRVGTDARAIMAIGVLGFGLGYCFSVSWPLFEVMAFPGTAVVVAWSLERARAESREVRHGAVLGLVAALIVLSGWRKASDPHSWGFWREPPLGTERGVFEDPMFAGVELSVPTAALFGAVKEIAETRTAPSDRMYVYPNMPVLYAVARRKPATYGLLHWVDICPDMLGEEDGRRLLENPPKLLILRDDPVGVVEHEERIFRGGRVSSVRKVLAALEQLRPRYTEVGVLNTGVSRPIRMLVRRDDGQQ